MKTLRQWNGDSNDLLLATLQKFGVNAGNIRLIKYEALTPDSFIWFLVVDGNHYCVYAEDYIPTTNHVNQMIKSNVTEWNHEDVFELMKVKDLVKWKESSPVKSADTYHKPEQAEELMKYATTSGVDFVFLARSKNNSKNNRA